MHACMNCFACGCCWGVCTVPDDRFRWLCGHFKPKSEVSATLSIFDIAGLVPGAHKGEGLGNAFISHIQAVDGIFHVVRNTKMQLKRSIQRALTCLIAC